MSCQLELFEEEKSEMECIKDDVKDVKESSDKVRRSMFARHAELTRKYLELSERMQILERNLCRPESSRMLSQF